MEKVDFLIIGSGIAGLTYAIKVAQKLPHAKVLIVTKSDENESNTKYAQGGIAVVIDNISDSYQQHIKDTLIAGDGLCDEKVVGFVVNEGPKRFNELVNWGAAFDYNNNGKYNLGLEGGHSKNRVLHHKDTTGLEIEKTLLAQIHQMQNIKVLSQHFAVELITAHHFVKTTKKESAKNECYGAYILNSSNGKITPYSSKITLLATGGVGQVYLNNTNPSIATGDGIAMAYRAKAHIKGMEFIQFHPTLLYQKNTNPSFLISEAVRGFGAYLINKAGHRFMEHYDDRKELASRDIVSRAIDDELKKSGDECVYLDCRHLDIDQFKIQFPTIYHKVKKIGIHPKNDLIPVVPAAHYLCGGITVNASGLTTIKRLFACGECSYTGLHGANRLASNSLLEALVFAHRCYKASVRLATKIKITEAISNWDDQGAAYPKELILITHNLRELQVLMSDYVGIVRSEERLEKANKRLNMLYEETEIIYKKTKLFPQLLELRNMLSVAHLIVQQSLKRKENCGVFYKSY